MFKYQDGDCVGPNNVVLLKRIKKYKDTRVWICEFKCPECGKSFQTYLNAISSGKTKRCPECSKNFKSNHLKKYHASKDITGQIFGKLKVIRPTEKRSGKDIVWECLCECKNIHYASIANLQNGHCSSCGCQVTSKGEDKIQKFLKNKNISFEKEKTFDDCVNPKTGYKLRFDFYLLDYNICIEFDGKQHFTDKQTWDSLEEIQYRDNIKNQYCKENGIKLIRIPYWDYSCIDNILLRELNLQNGV